MSEVKISVVCCDETPKKYSRIVEITINASLLNEGLLSTAEQEVAANEEKGLHNAAIHPEHGAVTYLQQVHEGGFSVLVGDPDDLQETFFGPGKFVAFIDAEGPGHASKVGPDGVKRTFRMLKGHVEV
jgi:hypothetical protein